MRGIARGVSREPTTEADCKPKPLAGGEPKGVHTCAPTAPNTPGGEAAGAPDAVAVTAAVPELLELE